MKSSRAKKRGAGRGRAPYVPKTLAAATSAATRPLGGRSRNDRLQDTTRASPTSHDTTGNPSPSLSLSLSPSPPSHFHSSPVPSHTRSPEREPDVDVDPDVLSHEFSVHPDFRSERARVEHEIASHATSLFVRERKVSRAPDLVALHPRSPHYVFTLWSPSPEPRFALERDALSALAAHPELANGLFARFCSSYFDGVRYAWFRSPVTFRAFRALVHGGMIDLRLPVARKAMPTPITVHPLRRLAPNVLAWLGTSTLAGCGPQLGLARDWFHFPEPGRALPPFAEWDWVPAPSVLLSRSASGPNAEWSVLHGEMTCLFAMWDAIHATAPAATDDGPPPLEPDAAKPAKLEPAPEPARNIQ